MTSFSFQKQVKLMPTPAALSEKFEPPMLYVFGVNSIPVVGTCEGGDFQNVHTEPKCSF